MSTPVLKIKVLPKPVIKGRMDVRFPANIHTEKFLKVDRANGTYTFDIDYSLMPVGPITDPTTAFVAIEDQSSGLYRTVSLASLLTSGLDADLQAIAALTGAGILARTADDTWALRTVTGTANEITVTNGDGVSGAPTVSLPAALTFTGKTVTGGTFAGAASYNKIAITAPATGATLTIADGKTLTVSNDATVSGTNTGDQTITLTGDVTGSGTGSFAATIGAGKVTSAMLNADVFSTAHSWSGVQTFTDSVANTQAPSDNSTKIATTAYVDNQVAGGVAGVASLNGQTGALVSYFPPQGRLTLASGVPVMSTSQAAKTTIYYTPYQGNMVPIYDGTNMVPTAFSEISVATTDTAKNPAAIGASKVNDWFVWNDSGTIRLSHGPDWTDDTTRSAGTALVRVNGIYLNNASITNGPAASRGTYVGTTRSNASSQLDWILGSAAAGGGMASLNVWNAYNQVHVGTTVRDSTASWTYSSATVRAANGSASNRVNFVTGLATHAVDAGQLVLVRPAATAVAFAYAGLALDSTTAFDITGRALTPASNTFDDTIVTRFVYPPQLGAHYVSAVEAGDGSTTATYFGLSSTQREALTFLTMM